MKQIIQIAKKEIKHILRDYRTLILLVSIPVIQLLVFAYVVSTDLDNIKIAILDNAKDEVSIELINRLKSSEYFIVEEIISDQNEVEQLFAKKDIKEVIVFEDGFSKNVYKEGKGKIQLIVDASVGSSAKRIVFYTSSIITDYFLEKQRNEPFLQIIPETRMLYNSNLDTAIMFIPGALTLLLMLITAILISLSIVKEKENGTMHLLLNSKLKPLHIITGKVIPYFFISLTICFIILFMGYYLFEISFYTNSFILLIAESTLFILLAASMGLLISSISNTQMNILLLFVFGLMLPTMLLSGFIFPVENMPLLLQIISKLMPPTWFIIIVKKLLLMNASISHVWVETLVIFGMSVFFIIMSFKRFKIRLD